MQDKRVILHADAAKSYKCKVQGVIRDNVIHATKGQEEWQVEVACSKLPSSRYPQDPRRQAKAQIIDRAWRFLKDRMPLSQNSKVGSKNLRAMLRSAQHEYWHKNADLWVSTGILCSWEVAKFMSKSCVKKMMWTTWGKLLRPLLHLQVCCASSLLFIQK